LTESAPIRRKCVPEKLIASDGPFEPAADYAAQGAFDQLLGQQQPYQVAGPAVAPGGQRRKPQAAPQAPPAQQPNRSQVQIPPEVAATIQKLGQDPRTRGQAWQLYMQYAKPVESIQPMSPEQRKQWQIPDGMSAGIDTVTGKPIFSPPQTNVNLNTAQKGQEVMATESAQDFKAAQAAGREAAKRSQVWDSMEQASKGFTPGATADIKLQAKRYLKDLGVIEGEDVPDAGSLQADAAAARHPCPAEGAGRGVELRARDVLEVDRQHDHEPGGTVRAIADGPQAR
jgi:hypothetical protein